MDYPLSQRRRSGAHPHGPGGLRVARGAFDAKDALR